MSLQPIERYYNESSSEFKAQQHIRDHIFYDPTITVQTMAACAAYAAVLRYATRGRDEYPIAPRHISELRAVLTNHAVDVIHSLISQTRSRLQPGSYALARRLAQESIDNMLKEGDNAETLLAIHSTPDPATSPGVTTSDGLTAMVGKGNADDRHHHHHHQHVHQQHHLQHFQHLHDTPQQPYFEHTHEGHDGFPPTPQRA